jgi:hypothetical protein
MKVLNNIPRQTIINAVEKAFVLMAPTYGPYGKGVLIDRDWTQELVDDGDKCFSHERLL